jgi:hypothetical protein
MQERKTRMTKRAPPQLQVVGLPGETETAAHARAAITPSMTAAATAQRYATAEGVDLTALSAELSRQASAIQSRDLSRAEEMLTAQAHTLDTIFNQLAGRAASAQYLPQLEAFLKLALRAQSQSRATWEAVSAIQHPPLAGYINQANIAGGHQQINNGARAQETARGPNQVQEQRDGEWLDSGAAGPCRRADPSMAALGEVDGSEDGGR